MAGYVILGTLAAMGLLSLLWIAFGWLLPGAQGGALVCMGWPDAALVNRYRWMREVGLVHFPMLIVSEELQEEEERLLGCGMELCTAQMLIARLEEERRISDGTGNGDPTGRHQRRGISEL